MPTFANLPEEKLLEGLKIMLEELIEQRTLPDLTDTEKQNILNTLTESFNDIFGPESTPQELFQNPAALKKLCLVACTIHLESTLSHDPALIKQNAMKLLLEPLDKNTLKEYLKCYNEMLPPNKQLGAEQIDELAEKLMPKIENQEEIDLQAELENELSDQQKLLLQMIGVAGSGFTIPILFIYGNAMGASDTAVNIGVGTTGALHMDTETCQSLNMATRDQIAENLAAVGDLTIISEAIMDTARHDNILKGGTPTLAPPIG